MTRLVTLLFALCAGALLAGITGTNAIPSQSISATNVASAAYQPGVTLTLNPQTYFIANAGLASTNALLGQLQITVDGTNWTTVATYRPAATNATTETWTPALSGLTPTLRVVLTTTNAVTAGAQATWIQ